ncbi:MAG: sugar phosphate isomerase/epimerase family protein [Candidatus Poribacteria bacterium]
MRIGIDSYCYHRYFGEVYDFQKDPGKRWSLEDFLKRAIELKVNGVSLETCFIPSFERYYLKKLKDTLDEANMDRVVAWGHPDGLEAGKNEKALRDLIKMIDVAEFMGGSKIMRIVGSSLMFRYESHEPQIKKLTQMLKEATKVAEDKGVILAMENHIDYTASEILDLINRVGSKHLGVNFDTGNALRLFEDPVEEAKILAPYIYATHIKDVNPKRGGSPKEWNFWESVPAGKGIVDIPGVMKVLKDQGYKGMLAIELDCLREEEEEDKAVEMSVSYLREQYAKLI